MDNCTEADNHSRDWVVSENQQASGAPPGFFWVPMVFIQCYLTLTVILFAFGPWPWPVRNHLEVYSYVIIGQCLIGLGYASARNFNCGRNKYISSEFAFKIALVASVLWILPNFWLRMGTVTFSISEIVNSIYTGLTDPGYAYKMKVASMKEGDSTPLVVYATLLLSPILSLCYPLGFFYWGSLTNTKRCVFIFLIICEIGSWLAAGSNKGIADLVVISPLMILAGHPYLLSRKNIIKSGIVLIFFAVSFLGLIQFFTSGQIGRAGVSSDNLYDYNADIYADSEHILLKYAPSEAKVGIASLISYMVQGYYGLSLCMEQPFVFTYGVGHAYYAASWSTRIVPEMELPMLTYPARAFATSGWSDFGRWHTIYPWLASDVTYPGALLILFVFSRMFALCWKDAVWSKNPVSIALVMQFMIMFVYLPSNNQVLGFPKSAFGFWGLLIIWLSSRQKRNLHTVPA